MLRMDRVHVIRHKVLVEGLSIRRVARELGVSRQVVRKYLRTAEPVRRESGPRPRPVLERVAKRIEELLEEWEPRTTPKQRITATRVHRRLLEEGYRAGITTVREVLAERRRRQAEVMIPLVHRPGEEAQVDFFEITVEVGGVMRKAWKFLLRLMYSGRDFAWLYEGCDQLAFLDGHVRAFAHLGGVPSRTVYDNLSSAVKRIVGVERELTERFLALSSHYLFEPCFARRGEGHDKGGVEGRGKGIRLQHLTPVPRGESLGAIAAELLAELDRSAAVTLDAQGQSILGRFEQERPVLRALPERPFEARRLELVSVSKQALVRIDGATYSVPSPWARLEAKAYVGVEDIRIACFGEEIVLPKQRRRGKEIRYRHYLRELGRKPQAVRQVAPELLAELGEPYGKLWELLVATHGEREGARVLAKVLAAIVDHGEDAVSRALEAALAAGATDLRALAASRACEGPAPIAVPATLADHQVEAGHAADYDWLLGGGGA
jgi:transposase